MNSDSCRFDCSNPPIALSPYPDISGIGVSLSYTLTAGAALFIVLVYYVFVYRPDRRPFNEANEQITRDIQDKHFEINPIDRHALGWRLSTVYLSHCNRNETTRKDRIGNALKHCMLVLSDFQLIAGLSIMISGFTQLRCGISIYHWHKVVQLAWFSSITHLCCLTFLRDFFYQHKLAQLWRIPGMVTLVIMLTFAFIPTAQYTWYFDNTMSRQDVILFVSKPAICSFFPHQDLTGFNNRAGNQRAGISIALLIIGMFVRLCHLYQAPTDAYIALRDWCSIQSKKELRKLYSWCNLDSPFPVLSTVFLYRPSLMVFLCYRILFNVASSKAFEVWWLALSYAWGALNLWHQKYDIEPESREWTFGQVIALVLLFAPLVALIEGCLINLLPSRPPLGELTLFEETPLLILQSRIPSYLGSQPEPAQASYFLEHGPDHDFYSMFSFSILVYATVFTIGQICIWTLILLAAGVFTPLDTFIIYTPYTLTMSFATCVLLSLIFSKFEPSSWKRRRVLQVVYFVLYFAMLQVGIVTGFMGMFFGYDMWLRIVYIGMYIGLSCWQAHRVKRRLNNSCDGIWRDE